MSRFYNYPEAEELQNDDVFLIDGETDGTRKIPANKMADFFGEQVPTDKTLSIENKAADAKKTGDEISELKSAFNELVEDKYKLIEPTNWFDANSITIGILNADGTVTESTTYAYTDYIPVANGDKIRVFRGDSMSAIYRRHITFYDSEKTVISGGSDSAGSGAYSVPNMAAYTRVTIDKPSSSFPIIITRDGDAPTTYTDYFDPYMAVDEDFLTDESESVINKLKNKEYKSSDFANRYACSMPLTSFRQTVGFAETFYGKTARTPDETTFLSVSVGVSYQERLTTDNMHFPNTDACSSVNGFYWRMYDSAYAEMYNNLTQTYASGQPRSIIAENLASCTLLAIGDSTVDHDVMTQKMLDAFTASGATLTLIGTLGSGNNKNEGRAGWKASDYLTNRTYDGVVNPFYNSTTGTFDFTYYMTNQGFETPDYVVIQLGINDLGSTRDYAAIWACITHMIDSIISYNSNIKIILNLPTTPTSNQALVQSAYLPEYKNRVVNYDAYAETHSLTEYGESKVRCSYCHIILDPDNDIRDNVHPTNEGYEKMALEVVNQINCWQNGV